MCVPTPTSTNKKRRIEGNTGGAKPNVVEDGPSEDAPPAVLARRTKKKAPKRVKREAYDEALEENEELQKANKVLQSKLDVSEEERAILLQGNRDLEELLQDVFGYFTRKTKGIRMRQVSTYMKRAAVRKIKRLLPDDTKLQGFTDLNDAAKHIMKMYSGPNNPIIKSKFDFEAARTFYSYVDLFWAMSQVGMLDAHPLLTDADIDEYIKEVKVYAATLNLGRDSTSASFIRFITRKDFVDDVKLERTNEERKQARIRAMPEHSPRTKQGRVGVMETAIARGEAAIPGQAIPHRRLPFGEDRQPVRPRGSRRAPATIMSSPTVYNQHGV